jgi:hypothetical protein
MDENKVEKWFKNVFDGKSNNEVIFIKSNRSLSDLKILQKRNVQFIENVQLNMNMNERARNIIIRTDDSSEFMKMNFAKETIVILEESSIEMLFHAMQKREFNLLSKVEYKFLEEITFEKIMEFEEKSLRDFIAKREWILKKINNHYEELDLDDIDHFLGIYFTRKILIAKFIQRLYRLATLNFIISEKKIGNILKKEFGVSSKTVTLKYIGMTGGTERILNRNRRVYDLNINQIEIDTKKEIAKKLIRLDIKELDINKIAQSTALPIKVIENLYKKAFIQ